MMILNTRIQSYEDPNDGRFYYYQQSYPSHSPSGATVNYRSSATSKTIVSSTFNPNQTNLNSVHELELNQRRMSTVSIIPFTYFYWLLVVLAILLTIVLVTFFIVFCKTVVQVKRSRRRRDSFNSYYRYRTVTRRIHPGTTFEPTAPPPVMVRAPVHPKQTLKPKNTENTLDELKTDVSPTLSRLDVFRKEPLSTFTSSSSNLHSDIQDRLSARSSGVQIKSEAIYESQRASMNLNNETNNESLKEAGT